MPNPLPNAGNPYETGGAATAVPRPTGAPVGEPVKHQFRMSAAYVGSRSAGVDAPDDAGELLPDDKDGRLMEIVLCSAVLCCVYAELAWRPCSPTSRPRPSDACSCEGDLGGLSSCS